jgi:hypothetical protein
VHRRVYARLAHAQKVEDDGVLTREIGLEFPLVPPIFVSDPLQATFDDGGLVEQYIICHRRCPASGCL